MTSGYITWETCPLCGLTAAVGWLDAVPVEFDCTAGCTSREAHLASLTQVPVSTSPTPEDRPPMDVATRFPEALHAELPRGASRACQPSRLAARRAAPRDGGSRLRSGVPWSQDVAVVARAPGPCPRPGRQRRQNRSPPPASWNQHVDRTPVRSASGHAQPCHDPRSRGAQHSSAVDGGAVRPASTGRVPGDDVEPAAQRAEEGISGGRPPRTRASSAAADSTRSSSAGHSCPRLMRADSCTIE